MQKKVLSFSLRATGWFLAGLGKLFPVLAARLFFRLYTTPPRRKTNGSQQSIKSKAVSGMVFFSRYAFEPDELKIATYRWPKPGRRVLLLHGWGSSALGFGALAEALALAGYEVIAYDAPAHGDSGGRRTNLVQWMHILDQYLSQAGPIEAIIGHSVGALNAALVLARKEHRPAKLILVSPPLSAPAFFGDTFDLFKISPNVIAGVYRLVRTQLKEELEGMDLHHYIGGIRAGQILLVYDERDQLVKHTELSAYSAGYAGMQTFKIKGEGHFRILKNPLVIGKIMEFLDEGR
ncbi:MAG TPA: alpha/beta hydrolase [Puia sp.]|nr:alpha/beta hydrolase [Puia sp.]